MNGILSVYKPVGITSFDVIRDFKRAVHPDFKIGHGGTLDPFADGVLLLLLGKATKKMNELSELPKTYRATAVLGASSDTLDKTGVITPGVKDSHTPGVSEIAEAVSKFIGEIEQEIPDYSATKINGVPRYKLARRGIEMERKSKMVTIHSIKNIQIKAFDGSSLPYGEAGHRTEVSFEVECSSGTYIRQLSYDLFISLGIESYLEALTRTKIGTFEIDQCAQMADFSSPNWLGRVMPAELPSHDE